MVNFGCVFIHILEQVIVDVIANDLMEDKSSEYCIQAYRIKRSGNLPIR